MLDLDGGTLTIRNNADLSLKAQDAATTTNTQLVVSQNATVIVARVTFAEGGRVHTLGNLWMVPNATLSLLRENFDGNSGITLRFDQMTLTGNGGLYIQNGTGTGDGQITVTNLTDNGGGFDLDVNGSGVIRSEFRVLDMMTLGGNVRVGAASSAVLHAMDGFANVAGNLQVVRGMILSGSDFVRELGDGPGQVRFTGGNRSGFGARAAAVSFALTQGGVTGLLTWGAPNFEVGTLNLNEDDAADMTLWNGIDLNSGDGTVTRQISAYAAVTSVKGAVTNTGSGTANFTKAEGGQLWLDGGASWNGTTRIIGGLLRIPTTDMLSPGYLDLNPGNTYAVLETAGVLTNSLGNAAGQVRLRGTGTATQTSRPGFSAFGGDFVIDIGGDGTGTGGELEWGSTYFYPEGPNVGNLGGLYLNSANADGTLMFMNPIDLKGIDFGTALPLRRFEVLGSTAVLAGDLRNSEPAFPVGIRKTGAGALVLLGNNTYDGFTLIEGGVLMLGTNGLSGSLGVGAVTNLGVLAFNRFNGMAVPNEILGTGTVMHLGDGETALTADNPYNGPTIVARGTLLIHGNHTGPGLITVAGGTLGGTGSVAGAIEVQGGATLAPGASAGVFTANANVTMQSNSTFQVELKGLAAGVDYDQLVKAGGTTLTLNNPNLSVLLDFSPNLGDWFTIATGYLSLAGAFQGLPVSGSTFSAGGADFRIDYNPGDITLTVVPEPVAALMAAAAAAMATLLRRRLRT